MHWSENVREKSQSVASSLTWCRTAKFRSDASVCHPGAMAFLCDDCRYTIGRFALSKTDLHHPEHSGTQFCSHIVPPLPGAASNAVIAYTAISILSVAPMMHVWRLPLACAAMYRRAISTQWQMRYSDERLVQQRMMHSAVRRLSQYIISLH